MGLFGSARRKQNGGNAVAADGKGTPPATTPRRGLFGRAMMNDGNDQTPNLADYLLFGPRTGGVMRARRNSDFAYNAAQEEVATSRAERDRVSQARTAYGATITDPAAQSEFALDPEGYLTRHQAPVWSPIPQGELPEGARFGQRNSRTGQADLDWAPPPGITLSPEATNFAAQMYSMTGQIPQGLSRSPRAASSIIEGAASTAAQEGRSVGEVAFGQANYQANRAGLQSLQRQRTMVQAFERTATANLELAARLSDSVDRTGSPIVNRWLLAGRQATGDPQVAQFHTALTSALNEYAKVLSGATGAAGITDSAREEAESLLNTAHTPEQVRAIMEVMRTEMHNRMVGFDEQEAYLRQQMTGGGNSGGGPAGAPKGAKDAGSEAAAAPGATARRYQWTPERGLH